MNYDPNLTNSGRMAVQTVKLTFGQWEYRAEHTTTVGGNCTGLSVIDCAIGNVLETLEYTTYKGRDYSRIVMKNAAGDELECEDEDLKCDDWLKDMLIAAEIVAIEPKPEKDEVGGGGAEQGDEDGESKSAACSPSDQALRPPEEKL